MRKPSSGEEEGSPAASETSMEGKRGFAQDTIARDAQQPFSSCLFRECRAAHCRRRKLLIGSNGSLRCYVLRLEPVHSAFARKRSKGTERCHMVLNGELPRARVLLDVELPGNRSERGTSRM